MRVNNKRAAFLSKVDLAYSIYLKGATLDKVASEMKCDRHTLAETFKRLGLKMRSAREIRDNYWTSDRGRQHAQRFSTERKQRPEFDSRQQRISDPEKSGCIYIVTNKTNGKRYVGQTISPLQKRWTNHKNSARNGTASPLYEAIRKYGHDQFNICEVFRCNDRSALDRAERLLIKLLETRAPNGYNVAPGGIVSAMTVEGRKRLSDRMRANNPMKNADVAKRAFEGRVPFERPWMMGANNPVHRSKPRNPDVIEKIKQKLRGQKRSPEQRQKMSIAKMGQPAWNKGRRRNRIVADIAGQKITFGELLDRSGVSVSCLEQRIRNGWTITKILHTPPQNH